MTPYAASPDEILAFRCRHMAVRMQMRVDAANERQSETVGISLGFAREIVAAFEAAEKRIEPSKTEPAKLMPDEGARPEEQVQEVGLMDDPKEIWLQPWCDECASEPHGDGRLWCQDDAWGKCEDGCGAPAVKYVLATERDALRARVEELEAALESMRPYVDKVADCIRINNEWGRVVVGQTEAAFNLANIFRAALKEKSDG